jgi:hypothetical protein
MATAAGRIGVVQEGRFRLLTDGGQGLLLTLGHDASIGDAELHELHGRLKASIPPHEMLDILRWLVPALSPAERAGMLNGARAELPPEAFQAMVGFVRPHLDAAAWSKLAPAIGVEQDPRFASIG